MVGARLPPAADRIMAIYARVCATGCVHFALSVCGMATKDTFCVKGQIKSFQKHQKYETFLKFEEF